MKLSDGFENSGVSQRATSKVSPEELKDVIKHGTETKAISLNDPVDCRYFATSRKDFLWNSSCSILCPFLIFGDIQTRLSREKADPVIPGCPLGCIGCNLGVKGRMKCFQCLPACLLCWPFPLCLIYELFQQRSRYRVIYDEPLPPSVSRWREILMVCLRWPLVLTQHHQYLSQKEKEGVLLFDWEEREDVMRDKNRPLPSIRTKVVAAIGPSGSGKNMLCGKLMSASNLSRTLKETNNLQVSFRPQSVCDEAVTFVEVWDIPDGLLDTPLLGQVLAKAATVVFAFNASDESGRSFAEMKAMYLYLQERCREKNKLVVGIKREGEGEEEGERGSQSAAHAAATLAAGMGLHFPISSRHPMGLSLAGSVDRLPGLDDNSVVSNGPLIPFDLDDPLAGFKGVGDLSDIGGDIGVLDGGGSAVMMGPGGGGGKGMLLYNLIDAQKWCDMQGVDMECVSVFDNAGIAKCYRKL